MQDDFGGTIEDYTPCKSGINLAVSAVIVCKNPALYARVDIVNDNEENPAISELELIEPEMWFRKNKKAARMLTQEIKSLSQNYY